MSSGGGATRARRRGERDREIRRKSFQEGRDGSIDGKLGFWPMCPDIVNGVPYWTFTP